MSSPFLVSVNLDWSSWAWVENTPRADDALEFKEMKNKDLGLLRAKIITIKGPTKILTVNSS